MLQVAAIALASNVLSLIGYVLAKKGRSYWRGLLPFQGVLIEIGDAVYLYGLVATFRAYAAAGIQDWWVASTEPSLTITIVRLYILGARSVFSNQIAVLECRFLA